MLEFGAPPDLARKVVRRNPELSKLGVAFGPTRVFTEDEARQILAAVREFEAKKRDAKKVNVVA
jgi:hypothetical protein